MSCTGVTIVLCFVSRWSEIWIQSVAGVVRHPIEYSTFPLHFCYVAAAVPEVIYNLFASHWISWNCFCLNLTISLAYNFHRLSYQFPGMNKPMSVHPTHVILPSCCPRPAVNPNQRVIHPTNCITRFYDSPTLWYSSHTTPKQRIVEFRPEHRGISQARQPEKD